MQKRGNMQKRGKMQKISMIVTDLDDTLLRPDKTISQFSLDIFDRCREEGIITAVATGRLEVEAQRFVDILRPDIVISNDGALARQSGKLIYKSELDADTTNRLIAEIMAHNALADIIVSAEETCYWNSLNISESPDRPTAEYMDYSTPLNRSVIKIVAEITDRDTALSISAKFPQCRVIPYWRINRYSYLREGTSKINAIRITAQKLGIDMEEVAAFGDDYNDIEMLTECGLGVAVANAIEPVLQSTIHRAGRNSEDGVALYIEENFLKRAF